MVGIVFHGSGFARSLTCYFSSWRYSCSLSHCPSHVQSTSSRYGGCQTATTGIRFSQLCPNNAVSCRHEGPVWQVAWAHPMYGNILASCSYDRKVIIWKEENGTWEKTYEYTGHDSSGAWCLELGRETGVTGGVRVGINPSLLRKKASFRQTGRLMERQ